MDVEAARDEMNGRTVILDGSNKIVSWVDPDPATAYAHIIELSVEFIENDVLLEHGYPMYYCLPVYQRDPPHSGVGFVSNPSDVLAGFIHGYVQDYYAFTGDADMKNEVILFADYMINFGRTPTGAGWAWSGCPYPHDYGGVSPPRASDRDGTIMPHIAAKLGRYYVWLYKSTENTTCLQAAIDCADSLAANRQTGSLTQSPWPFRVLPETGALYEDNEYCGDVIDPIALFDELIALGYTGSGTYTLARDQAWTWLMSPQGPIITENWSNYFENVSYMATNNCQINIGETTRYLLEHPDLDPSWQTLALNLIGQMESQFGLDMYGAMTMREQFINYYSMISHTARYASVCALYFELTGDADYKEKAFRAFNWSTYGSTVEIDRVFTEQMDQNYGWFSDCHSDFIQHIFAGMASVPEWAPNNENHMLRSSSVIQTISYQPDSITYETFDSASIEVLRLTIKPELVTADGALLPERPDLTQPGWTWETLSTGGVCRIRHDAQTTIILSWPPIPSLSFWSMSILLVLFGTAITRHRRTLRIY